MQTDQVLAAVPPLAPDRESADDADLMIDTLKEVTSALTEAGVRHALTGSFAAYARGGALSQHDVDFLVHEDDLPVAMEALAARGFRVERVPEDWLVKAYDGDRMIDLIFRPLREPVTDALLADADEQCVGGAYLPVMSATVLLTHKLRAFNAQSCDFTDGLPLARALREQVDWKRVADRTSDTAYGRAFLFLLRELDIVDLPPLED